MTRLIPAWLTAHRAVLVALVVLAAVSFVVAATDDEFAYRPAALAVSLLMALVVSAVVTVAGAALVRVPPGSDSWAITGLILFFLMPGITDVASAVSMIVAAGAAAASKYVLVWRRRLIVNPAVAGAVVAYGLAYSGVSVGGTQLSSPFWWVAAEPLFWPMVVIGLLLVTVLRVWEPVMVYLAVALITIGVVELVRGGQDLQLWFVSTPTFFVAAVMLPEPLTSPSTRLHRAVYAALVAVLMFWQQTFEITTSFTLEFVPQIALLAGCLYAFAVRLAGRAPAGRTVLATSAQPIAAQTFELDGRSSAPVGFTPGQWAMLSAPSWSTPLWGGSRRVFSFASAPDDDAVRFGFTVGSAGGVSSYKSALIEGTTHRLYLDVVGGDFTLPRAWRRDAARRPPVVLIASGIGITPFASMVAAGLASDKNLTGLRLVHVVRAADRAVYTADLAAAAAAGAQLDVIESADPAKEFADPARLSAIVGATWTGDAATRYYVSGAPDFVRNTATSVRRMESGVGWRFWRLRTDTFLGY
ncbi:FAD-dependent oxidoreductase [Gordonia sp. NPDC003425]